MLGYREEGEEDLVDPRARGPSIWFQQRDALRPQRNRITWTSPCHDQAEARIAAAIAAGDHLVTDQHAPEWWTVAEPRATRPTWPPG